MVQKGFPSRPERFPSSQGPFLSRMGLLFREGVLFGEDSQPKENILSRDASFLGFLSRGASFLQRNFFLDGLLSKGPLYPIGPLYSFYNRVSDSTYRASFLEVLIYRDDRYLWRNSFLEGSFVQRGSLVQRKPPV